MFTVWMRHLAGAARGLALAPNVTRALAVLAPALALGGALAPAAQAGSYQVVYRFQGGADGARPQGGMVAKGGRLVGTTQQGGQSCGTGPDAPGCGTLFALDPASGAETVLYRFRGLAGRDGMQPNAALANIDGTIYGSTALGGAACAPGMFWGCGAVFALGPSGQESVLHVFAGGADGSTPTGGLIGHDGALYGVTKFGGSGQCFGGQGCGTLFSVDPATGATATRARFQPDPSGSMPAAAPVSAIGKLYGTASLGTGGALGTLVSFDPAKNAFAAASSFRITSDGYGPSAAPVAWHGVLYGTTPYGGAFGAGLVWSLNPATGTRKTVYSFKGNRAGDADTPSSGLTPLGGLLYGLSLYGGAQHLGALFMINPASGTVTVLHSFSSAGDGFLPAGNLVAVGGTLYGTTQYGATPGGAAPACDWGCGVVFAFTP